MTPPDLPMTDEPGHQPSLAALKTRIRRSIQRFDAGEEEAAINAAIRTVTRAEDRGIAPETLLEREDMPVELAKAVREALIEPLDAGTGPEDAGTEAVDLSEMRTIGTGAECLYAYGLSGYPDRLRIGMTASGTAEQRVAQQIGTGMPDRPKLYLVYQCRNARRLERAVHAVLDCRGRRIAGVGREWFRCSVEDLLELVAFIVDEGEAA